MQNFVEERLNSYWLFLPRDAAFYTFLQSSFRPGFWHVLQIATFFTEKSLGRTRRSQTNDGQHFFTRLYIYNSKSRCNSGKSPKSNVFEEISEQIYLRSTVKLVQQYHIFTRFVAPNDFSIVKNVQESNMNECKQKT